MEHDLPGGSGGSGAKVDTGIMLAGANTIKAAADDITDQMRQFGMVIEGLRSTWKGASAQTFDSAVQEFYNDCNQIVGKLTKLSQDVNGAVGNYSSGHDAVSSLVQSFSRVSTSTPSAGLPGF